MVEVVGNVGGIDPTQTESIGKKVGAIGLFTVTVIVVFPTVHCPGFGVNVYVPVVVLSITEGLHAPVILLSEVPGNIGGAIPLQIEVGNEKLGIIIVATVKFNVVIESHPAAFTRVITYMPAEEYKLPFQLKGNDDVHIVSEVVLAESWSTVTVIVVFPTVHCPGFGVNI